MTDLMDGPSDGDMVLDGAIEPPSANGEVVFEAPWQSRTFAMARALCEQGHYSWDEFRTYLIEAVRQADLKPEAPYHYFDCFQLALTKLLSDKALCPQSELEHRANEFAARPHGHDHKH